MCLTEENIQIVVNSFDAITGYLFAKVNER
jgi:hypothetical protein